MTNVTDRTAKLTSNAASMTNVINSWAFELYAKPLVAEYEDVIISMYFGMPSRNNATNDPIINAADAVFRQYPGVVYSA